MVNRTDSVINNRVRTGVAVVGTGVEAADEWTAGWRDADVGTEGN